MKNKAFTMAEALIALALVAVLAALSVVAISNSKPDESIIKFRKGYATTVRVVNELLNDEELYPHAKESYNSMPNLISAENIKGLRDDAVTSEMQTKYSFLNNNIGMKFWQLFRYKVNAVEDLNTGYFGGGDNARAFRSPDGITWFVHDYFTGSWGLGGQIANVWIYTNNSSSSSGACEYNADTCKIPTKFHLSVYYNGKIRTNDPMACSYLRYPKINKAKKIPTDPNVNSCFANLYIL